jgi:hypothetical protein
MKRQGNLWPAVTSFENLLLAAKKAQLGKRYRANVLEFNYNLEGGINSKRDKDPIDSIERPSSPSPCLTLLPWSGNPTGAERFSQGGRRGAGAQSEVSCSLSPCGRGLG